MAVNDDQIWYCFNPSCNKENNVENYCCQDCGAPKPDKIEVAVKPDLPEPQYLNCPSCNIRQPFTGNPNCIACGAILYQIPLSRKDGAKSLENFLEPINERLFRVQEVISESTNLIISRQNELIRLREELEREKDRSSTELKETRDELLFRLKLFETTLKDELSEIVDETLYKLKIIEVQIQEKEKRE